MSEPTSDPRTERVAEAVATWTRHLVDLGGRNTLLWYRDLSAGTLDLTHTHPGGLAGLMASGGARLGDLFREPSALDDARRRARAIGAKTRELLEERGIRTGFAAVGLATWDWGAEGARNPTAPVLLRACTIRPIGAGWVDAELSLEDEVEFNPVLAHFLRTARGIEIDEVAMEALATESGAFNPEPVYAALTRACGSLPTFAIAPRLVVGTFSYAKLPMVADLTTQGMELARHDVIAALAGDDVALAALRSDRGAAAPTGPPAAPGASAEAVAGTTGPASDLCVLDADTSQTAAVEAARSGSHLVIHGPPGTGKSQTIANLIATLAADGRSVLFVAEKRAAIDAVVGRLERVGLGDLLLDLHDGGRSRSAVVKDLVATLDRRRAHEADPRETLAVERRGEARAAYADELDDHARALHALREPWEVSVHDAQEALTVLTAGEDPPRSRVRLRPDRAIGLDRTTFDGHVRLLDEAASLGAWSTTLQDDPWFGARITTTAEAERAQTIVDRLAAGAVDEVESLIRSVFADMGMPQASSLRGWGRVLDTVSGVRETLEIFRPEIFDIPLGDLVAATAPRETRERLGTDLGWWERRRLLKQARSLLRPGQPPLDLHRALEDAQEQRVAWAALAGLGGRPEVPGDLDRATAAWRGLVTEVEWLGERLPHGSGCEGGLAGHSLAERPLAEVTETGSVLAAHTERLAVLPAVAGVLGELEAAGLQPLVADCAARGVPPERVGLEADLVWWASVVADAQLHDVALGGHDGARLTRVVADFVEADREVIADNVERVRLAVADRLRRVLRQAPARESLLRTEAARARRVRPIRDLVTEAGPLLTAIAPCWVMSPLVVASVLPAGRVFDVVVFDEASQIPPAEAVSAISRAERVVVAGDTRQLPPTTFFTSADEGPADLPAGSPDGSGGRSLTDGVDSILDILAALLPSRTLTWHYRSRDERLIEFANEHIYGGSLLTFPGVGAEPVLTLHHVAAQGMVDEAAGAVPTTAAEVDEVVALALSHARTRPGESLGIIALGLTHAARIEEALRRELGSVDEATAAFFGAEGPEPFFVKNLERVQGDERDAIILAVGFAKTPHGRVLHRFGPLNLDGGERRLNVAITRARQRMDVVSALVADDLDPARLKAAGAAMLREFLAHVAARAERSAPEGGVRSEANPSAVVADLATRLRAEGLTVHCGLGSSTLPIDLAVEAPGEPGRLALAIEADGPVYAANPSVRDRDRLRPEQLARLGWTHRRVWTTDVFRDPGRVVAQVLADLGRSPAPAQGEEHGGDA